MKRSEIFPLFPQKHQLSEEQVARTPNNTAVVFKDEQLTYQELNERANRLAHYLQAKGAESEDITLTEGPGGSEGSRDETKEGVFSATAGLPQRQFRQTETPMPWVPLTNIEKVQNPLYVEFKMEILRYMQAHNQEFPQPRKWHPGMSQTEREQVRFFNYSLAESRGLLDVDGNPKNALPSQFTYGQ